MAIAFARAKSISRAKTQSAVACSAYRSCEKLKDERNEKVHDYSRKKGHISGDLELPPGVKMTKEELWNLVEASEKRIDARLSKELIVAFPKEFSDEENTKLAQGIAKLLAIEHKVDGSDNYYPVQWDVHGPHIESEIDDNGEFVFDEKGNKKLLNNGNNHGHFMITERAWDYKINGFSSKKDRNRNSKDWLAKKKLEIGEYMNSMLREKGLPEIDFRSWEERNQESIKNTGKELAKPQKHNGPSKTNKERKNRKSMARKKQNIKNEIKILEAAISKIDKEQKNKANANSSDRNKALSYVPGSENWTEEISKSVNKNLSDKEEAKKQKQIDSSAARITEGPVVKKQTKQEIKVEPVPSSVHITRSGSGNHKVNAGPEVKCLLCIPDGSSRCKVCKFREKEKSIDDDYGYSR